MVFKTALYTSTPCCLQGKIDSKTTTKRHGYRPHTARVAISILELIFALLRRSADLLPHPPRFGKRPQPGRLDDLQHVDHVLIINLSTPARSVGHFTEHGRASIGILAQGSLVIQFGHLGLWQSCHHSFLHHHDCTYSTPSISSIPFMLMPSRAPHVGR